MSFSFCHDWARIAFIGDVSFNTKRMPIKVNLYDLAIAKIAILCVEFNFLIPCHGNYSLRSIQYWIYFDITVLYQNFIIFLFISQFTCPTVKIFLLYFDIFSCTNIRCPNQSSL